MQRIVAEASEQRGTDAMLLFAEGNTQAYRGHAGKSRELTDKAVELAKRAGDREVAAEYLGEAALREARVYAQARNIESSRTAYATFFPLWQDADPDIPILKKPKRSTRSSSNLLFLLVADAEASRYSYVDSNHGTVYAPRPVVNAW